MEKNQTVDAVLAQYEKNLTEKPATTTRLSDEDRLKRYFTTYLPKGTQSGQKRIRILPTEDGSSPFKEVWYHNIQIDGKYTKLYDPGMNDGERSPLSEVYEELRSTGKEEDKELAKDYRPRKFYIVKVIDRDNEDHGVKFWRFKDNYKREGILDKIIPIWKAKGNITDPDNGRDLILELIRVKNQKGTEYTIVQTVMHDDPSPLHEDKEQAREWLENELTWQDVYSKKPIEYLEAVAAGETPVWSTELNKYVYGDEAEQVIGGGTQPSDDDYEDPQANEMPDPDEELPF